jgi:hypothetical protein
MKLKNIIIFIFIVLLQSSIVYAELRDPTKPPGYINSDTASISTWQLDAVIIGKDRSLAIINGQVFKVGDEVNSNRLMSITPYSVQLEGIDGKMTLFLLDNSFKIE